MIKLADEINCLTDLDPPAVRRAKQKLKEEAVEYRRQYAIYRKYIDDLKEYERLKVQYERDQPNAGLSASRDGNPLDGLKPPVPPEPVAEPIPPDGLFTPSRKQANREKDARQMNLRNRDRKLIAAVIDSFFEKERPNTRDCYEKRQLWAGLLHHIHYQPKNEAAAEFVRAMRGEGENKSVNSAFEAAMAAGDVKKAVHVLATGKGSGTVGRSLNYLLSRAKDESDVDAVVSHLDNLNLILLIQMIRQYKHYHADRRTFKFVRHHLMTTHKETDEEMDARRSIIPESVRSMLETYLIALLKKKLAEKAIGRVYVEDGMEKISVPLQEATGASGLGVLPRGSRLRIGEGNKLRCFTYWEKVDDIDLACFGLGETGLDQREFSWRSMWEEQDDCIIFSGDETSGYYGGSEYFDIVIPEFREKYPDVRYLVFTDNVYTGIDFNRVECTAGYMIREEEDSGEIFEPKTVKSSFRITGESTFAVLFALDLKEREIIWLNIIMDSEDAIAGENEMAMVRDYLDATDTISVGTMFRGMATEIVEKPEDADVIVADHFDGELRQGQKLIRSCDYELIFEYLNVPKKKA